MQIKFREVDEYVGIYCFVTSSHDTLMITPILGDACLPFNLSTLKDPIFVPWLSGWPPLPHSVAILHPQ